MKRRLLPLLLVGVLATVLGTLAVSPIECAAHPGVGAPDVFRSYLNAAAPPADGFDFPLGDAEGKGAYTDLRSGKTHRGWYVATHFGERISLGLHPGEDWNGKGGANTDLGQPVHAVARGKVVFADSCGAPWGGVVVVQHVFYVNHEKKRIRSLYAHLQSWKVRKGETVRRRQAIGTVGQDPDRKYLAHLHLELRWNEDLAADYWPSRHGRSLEWVRKNYAPPTQFIGEHRRLFVPQKESTLVLVDHASYRMRLYRRGRLEGDHAVSFGQARGRKQRRGDNRTPKGMYFVVSRYRGAFSGDYGAYFGGHWIKLNYPNTYDAARGRKQKWITAARQREIASAWRERKPTFGKSKLGGGIGFHGWINEWPDSGPRHLSWGCIVMHNRDIARVFSEIPKGTMVVLF